MMPQQNAISWEREHTTAASPNKGSTSINATQILETSLDSVEPSVRKVGLPPKSYSQPSIGQQVSKYTISSVAFVVCLTLPLALLPPLMVNYKDSNSENIQGTFCTNPDSIWQITELNNPTSTSDLFKITNGYGSFSYGMARFIDLVWDLIVSRCRQSLLAWVSYRVYTDALLRIMESQLVSYNLYSTLTLSWPTVWSLVPLAKSIFSLPGFRSKFLLIWLALSSLWIGFWPSITNAMTGYIPENNTLVQLKNGTGFVNYTDIATTSNVAFQCSVSYPKNDTYPVTLGPILLNTGPNVTLYNSLYQSQY